MKQIEAKGFKKVLGLGIAGMILLCACGGYTSVTEDEAYQAGHTIGRLIGGY